MRLFRATSIDEVESIRLHAEFRTSRNTLEAKQFFKSVRAIEEFVRKARAQNYRPPYTSYIEFEVSDDCLNDTIFTEQELDGFEALTVDEEHLVTFNNCVNFTELIYNAL